MVITNSPPPLFCVKKPSKSLISNCRERDKQVVNRVDRKVVQKASEVVQTRSEVVQNKLQVVQKVSEVVQNQPQVVQ